MLTQIIFHNITVLTSFDETSIALVSMRLLFKNMKNLLNGSVFQIIPHITVTLQLEAQFTITFILLWSVLCLSRLAGIWLICFLSGRATKDEKGHLAWKSVYGFHSETHGLQRDRTLAHSLAHEHASHCWHTSCSKGVLINSTSWDGSWRILLPLSVGSCIILLPVSGGTYEITLHFSCWLIPMLTWTIRKSETVLCAMNIRCISEGVYSKYPLNFKPYTHTNFPVTKDGTKALFRVLGGKNNRCCWTTPYIRLTRYRGPMTSGGGSLCFNFFLIYKTNNKLCGGLFCTLNHIM